MPKLKAMGHVVVTPLTKVEVRSLAKKGLVELTISAPEASVTVELTARQAEDLALILPGAARDARGEADG